jgi:hypothetical protein
VLAGTALLLNPAAGLAACTTADLAGTWVWYVTTALGSGKYGARQFEFACTLTLDADGAPATTQETSCDQIELSRLNGSIRIDHAFTAAPTANGICQVRYTGQIRVMLQGTGDSPGWIWPFTSFRGALTPSKEVLSGVLSAAQGMDGGKIIGFRAN